MQNQGGKEKASEQSPVETSAQVAVTGPADAGQAASPSCEKAHKKRTKKRTKSLDANCRDSKSPEGGAESPIARNKKPKRQSKAKNSGGTSEPPPLLSPIDSPLELSQPPLPSVGKLATTPDALLAAPPPGAPEAPKPADLATYPPARDVPALVGFDNTLATTEQREPKTVIIPMIGSAVIICLMLVVVIGMLVSNRRRARVTDMNATRPTTVISDDVEVTATSATTTSVTTPSATTTGTTGTENTTISHSQGVAVEKTEPVSWDTPTFLVVP
ncbi:uncharacterized protein LOC142557992 [Dermacentor variabilis]|uniref:uncharacterized protein LOC142557992 n=1 Tax=Dermacentor variabilis TaxID=34621 RepID=UPI003F5C5711